MGIDRLRANLAVMSILRNQGVPLLGRIELTALRARWGRYALRARDLEGSLQRLEAIGFIEIDKKRGRQYVVLTEMGYRSAHSFFGFIESLLTWPRRIAQGVRRLGRPLATQDLSRRASDRGSGDHQDMW